MELSDWKLDVYISQEFKGQVWAGGINVEIINMLTVLKEE